MKMLSPRGVKKWNSKSLLVFILCLVLVCVQTIPAAALAEVNTPSSKYTVSNGIMAFGYGFEHNGVAGNFDIKGFYGDKWKRTTFSDYGYETYLKTSSGTTRVIASKDGVTVGGLNIKITAKNLVEPATALKIIYTVQNPNDSEDITFSLGTGTDVKIGFDDYARITMIGNKNGLKMVSGHSDDCVNDAYAQFSFFGSGYDGVTDVTNFWYGGYDSGTYTWYGNESKAVFYNSDQSYESDYAYDSAMSWHWDDTLPAGETKVYSVLIAIGESGSDDDVPGTSLNSPTGSVILNLSEPATGEEDFTITVNNQVLTPNDDYTVSNAYTNRPIIQFTENALGITCDVKSIDVQVNSTKETASITVALPHSDANGHDAAMRPGNPNPNPNPDPGVPVVPVSPPVYPNLPKTGDSTPIILYFVLAVCSGYALLMLQRIAKNRLS